MVLDGLGNEVCPQPFVEVRPGRQALQASLLDVLGLGTRSIDFVIAIGLSPTYFVHRRT